jgi:hypothetical protein
MVAGKLKTQTEPPQVALDVTCTALTRRFFHLKVAENWSGRGIFMHESVDFERITSL